MRNLILISILAAGFCVVLNIKKLCTSLNYINIANFTAEMNMAISVIQYLVVPQEFVLFIFLPLIKKSFLRYKEFDAVFMLCHLMEKETIESFSFSCKRETIPMAYLDESKPREFRGCAFETYAGTKTFPLIQCLEDFDTG